MALSPTPEQRAAIEHPLADACVTAGAGSGKTAVLTRRYVHLVCEHGLPVRRVAALTFTEKAAAQMRERIAGALEEGGRHAEREEVEFAPISTIHAFCARLLRLQAVDAGLDPAFVVLDESESSLMREDAWDAALARLVHEGSPDVAVLSRIAMTDPKKEGLTFLAKVRGTGVSPEALRWRTGDPPFGAASAAALLAASDFLDAAAHVDPEVDARAREVVARLRDALEQARAWDLDALVEEVKSVRPERGNGPRPFTTSRKALCEAVQGAAASALDAVGAEDVAGPLGRVLAAVDASYRAAKDDRSALDFTDLELEALGLLEGLRAKGRRAAHAPAALLVDEYQDTNPLQARILEALRGMGPAQFSVGDPKQSIYRFRRADVRVIGAEAERVGEAGRHVLRATFRARPSLVDCLNGVHAPLFGGGAAGAEHVPLRAEGMFREVEGPDVEFVVLDGGAGCSADERRAHEARWIATWIRDLVGRRVPRAKLETDADGAETPARALSYGDVAILLRARTSLTIYEDALAALDIPFHTHKGRGYFQTEEVVDLIHALRVIHDPADDFALAAFATGPVLGARDADLLDMFPDRSSGRSPPGTAWSRFVRRAEGREADVARVMGRLRREALAGRLGRVVEGVLYDLGLLEAALLQTDGARRGANLRKAVAVARDLERSGREGLDDLLRTLAQLRDREVAESEAALGREDEDVVRINTVHGAKGLEYPVVILADVGRKPGGGRDPILYDGEGAFAIKLRHPLEGSDAKPAGLATLRQTEDAREEEESRRLLYVGTTRAEERLLLVGSCAGETNDGRLKEFQGWGPWLVDAFGHQPAFESREVAYGRGLASIRREGPLPAPPPPAPPPALAAPSAEAQRRAAALVEAATVSVTPLGDTPFAVTVSELLDFAASPARHYTRRLDPRVLSELRAVAEPDDPASGEEHADPGSARAEERARLWDEEAIHDGIDRASLGRALHSLLETFHPGKDAVDSGEIARVLEAEFPAGAPASAEPLLRDMVARFASSTTGVRLGEALRSGADLRREIAFHARIRFPAGAVVGGFDSLLVRGSIDLWLPDADGRIRVVDHKTNPPSGRLRSPEAVGEHYAWQLRLYALAAERMLGEDVAGAHLLLLDPGWGPDAVEVAVDVSGDALEDARRLCRAYAMASLENRWPASWEDLLSPSA